MDWLAEQYVVLVTKTAFFLENPTACPWIGFFQSAGLVLGLVWLTRTGFLAIRGHQICSNRRLGTNAFGSPDDEAKLATAFHQIREKVANMPGGRYARRLNGRERLRIHEDSHPTLCNIGYFRPQIFVSSQTIRVFDSVELAAALTHELAHVVRRDNLKRAAVEMACFLAPVAMGWGTSLKLAVSTRSEFLTALAAGIGLGVILRMLVVPAIAYWQERRCDEWAAIAVGDRLVVASALVKVASLAEARQKTNLVPSAATPFAFYHRPVSSRVRRLVESKGSFVRGADRFGRVMLRSLVVGVLALSLLAAHRAQTLGLEGNAQFQSCAPVLGFEK